MDTRAQFFMEKFQKKNTRLKSHIDSCVSFERAINCKIFSSRFRFMDQSGFVRSYHSTFSSPRSFPFVPPMSPVARPHSHQILEAWSQTALVWALHLNHLPLSIAALESYRATARVHHPRSLARLVLQLYLAIQVCACM